jgi:BCCT family betaine/carnitine transporter
MSSETSARVTDPLNQAEPLTSNRYNIDWFIFIGSLAIIIGVCVPLTLYPESGKEVLTEGYNYITSSIGVLYVLFSVSALGVLLYLAFSRHGDVLLGDAGTTPEYSAMSWASMLFCGGIGASVMYWGTIEWAQYVLAPPFGVEPRTEEAVAWAQSYPIFHWGFIGWALYCLPAVAIAHAYHVRKIPALRLSSVCEPVLGRYSKGVWGGVVDLTFVVGLLGAASTGIGLVVPLISESMRRLVGMSEGFGTDLSVIVVITLIFSVSVWMGIDKGIKRLSNLNIVLAMIFLAFVFIAGPTRFIAESAMSSVGHLLQNFPKMSFWTDPNEHASFVEDWTIFYWSWWLALGPFMGMFISKISRGRTIREVIIGSIGYGTAGCGLFFMILGNYALFLNNAGTLTVLDTVAELGSTVAILDVVTTLPLTGVMLPLFMVVSLIFAATSYDSISYVLASATTQHLPSDQHPARWNRLFWAFSLGLIPTTLIYIGGLKALQSAVVAASLPLLIVTSIMTVALFRGLNNSEQNTAKNTANITSRNLSTSEDTP